MRSINHGGIERSSVDEENMQVTHAISRNAVCNRNKDFYIGLSEPTVRPGEISGGNQVGGISGWNQVGHTW